MSWLIINAAAGRSKNSYVLVFCYQLSDRRNVHFKDVRSKLFDGEGQPLGGSSVTSRLVNNIHSLLSPSTNQTQEETELPGKFVGSFGESAMLSWSQPYLTLLFPMIFSSS
jgi:hypothetical protein